MSTCYMNHVTGDSDHMNAHIKTEKCQLTPSPENTIANLRKAMNRAVQDLHVVERYQTDALLRSGVARVANILALAAAVTTTKENA